MLTEIRDQLILLARRAPKMIGSDDGTIALPMKLYMEGDLCRFTEEKKTC